MARTKRSAKLDTWNARKKLPQGKTNQEPLADGQYLGYRRPKSGAAGAWFARWRTEGKIRQEHLGTADDFHDADGQAFLSYAQAEKAAKAWFKKKAKDALHLAGGEVAHEGPYTVGDAIRAYFEDGRRRGVRGLKRDESRAALWILPVLGPLEVEKLTRHRLESWLTMIADSPRQVRTGKMLSTDLPAPKPRNFKVPRLPKPKKGSPSPPSSEEEKRARKDSANRILTTLKAALNYALDRQHVTNAEAWRHVKPYPGTTRARLRFLTVEDQVRLVNVCPDDFKRLVKGALLTGGRYGELTRSLVQDFDATGGTLFLVGKGTGEGKPRRVVLTDEGRAFFQGITAGKPAGEPIFQRGGEIKRRSLPDRGQSWSQSDQARVMKSACEAAGLDPLSFHELRHSYASMLVNKGVPLVYVAAQLGHSDTRMVEKHYGHLAPNALADSIRNLMPRLGFTELSAIEPLKVSGQSE